ncbi:MAG: hypothetical protein EOP00_28080 [Pedobacter sp.]|nr:MAG: hypothetical protein EOP00_28080 [Pedobacter sp.]
MKIITTVTLLLFLVAFKVNAQTESKVKYFDINYKEITEKEFKKARQTNTVLDIVIDSTQNRKLIERQEVGSVDRRKIQMALEKATNKEIDSNEFIVIIYHPGPDPCNSSGSGDMEIAYSLITTGVSKVVKANIAYIYKNLNGEEAVSRTARWNDDPDNLIERTFFKYPYPCGSFAVIDKSGNYISYFGEYPTYYVANAIELLKKK